MRIHPRHPKGYISNAKVVRGFLWGRRLHGHRLFSTGGRRAALHSFGEIVARLEWPPNTDAPTVTIEVSAEDVSSRSMAAHIALVYKEARARGLRVLVGDLDNEEETNV